MGRDRGIMGGIMGRLMGRHGGIMGRLVGRHGANMGRDGGIVGRLVGRSFGRSDAAHAGQARAFLLCCETLSS